MAQNENKQQFDKKKVVKDVKGFNKEGKFSNMDDLLRSTFQKYPESAIDPELLNYQTSAQYNLYLEENKKMFLNGKGDTIKFFTHIYNTYYYGLKCDSVSKPSAVGAKDGGRFFADINTKLSTLRNNLKNGGLYFMKKKNYAEAFKFFDIYLDSRNNPVVYVQKKGHFTLGDDSTRISKLALHAAYGSQQYEKVMKYLPLAIADTLRKQEMLEMSAKSALQLNDSTKFFRLIYDGFTEFPYNEYFSANLIQYYHNKNDFQNTMIVIDKCLSVDSNKAKYWVLKGNEYFEINAIDKAQDAYEKAITINANNTEVLSKLGNMYVKRAHDFYDTADLAIGSANYSDNRAKLNSIYEKAMGYYEKLMCLKPDEPGLWKEGLQEVYFKLNKGEELRKLERY